LKGETVVKSRISILHYIIIISSICIAIYAECNDKYLYSDASPVEGECETDDCGYIQTSGTWVTCYAFAVGQHCEALSYQNLIAKLFYHGTCVNHECQGGEQMGDPWLTLSIVTVNQQCPGS